MKWVSASNKKNPKYYIKIWRNKCVKGQRLQSVFSLCWRAVIMGQRWVLGLTVTWVCTEEIKHSRHTPTYRKNHPRTRESRRKGGRQDGKRRQDRKNKQSQTRTFPFYTGLKWMSGPRTPLSSFPMSSWHHWAAAAATATGQQHFLFHPDLIRLHIILCMGDVIKQTTKLLNKVWTLSLL